MRIFLILTFLLSCTSAQAGEIPSRVVSVGGALTEMIYALGEGDRIVGSDTTSYYPAEAEKLPKVGYMRNLSAEGVLSLKPDLLLLDDDAGPPPVLAQLKNSGLKIQQLRSAKSLAGIKENLIVLGEVFQRQEKSRSLIASLDAVLDEVAEKVKTQASKPKVLFLMNHGGGTPMVAGANTAADMLINLAGGSNVANVFERYKPLTPEAAVKYAPDIILITTASLEMIGGKTGLLKFPGVGLTPAGKMGNVIDMDALLLLGLGPRMGEAALELHEKLQAAK